MRSCNRLAITGRFHGRVIGLRLGYQVGAFSGGVLARSGAVQRPGVSPVPRNRLLAGCLLANSIPPNSKHYRQACGRDKALPRSTPVRGSALQ